MPDISAQIEEKYVTENIVKKYGDACIIVGEGGVVSGKDDNGVEYERPYVVVEFPPIEGKSSQFELRLSPSVGRAFAAKIGSTDTSNWIGARVLLTEDTGPRGKYIKPVCSDVPPKAKKNGK